jgi:hypothetical protein
MTGPPLFPGLIAASIWMLRCESTVECVYVRKSIRETTETLAADGKTKHGDRRLEFRNSADGEWLGAGKEAGIVYLQESEVAVVRDVFHPGDVFARVALFLDREELRIRDDVRIGHQAVACDDPAGAGTATLRAGQPRDAVIRILRGVADSSHRFANLGGLTERGSRARDGEHDKGTVANHEARTLADSARAASCTSGFRVSSLSLFFSPHRPHPNGTARVRRTRLRAQGPDAPAGATR